MKFIILILTILVFSSCSDTCEKNVVCKFKKGDIVQVKSSRWAKKGTVTDYEITGDCECEYQVSQTTWLEGRTYRTFTEYELEPEGDGLDEDADKILDKLTK